MMSMKKKQYISPEVEVFVCKINSLLMASGDLGSPESIEDVIPSTDPPQDDVFNSREYGW